MKPNPYDLVVIGGGPAGYVGAIRAAQLGMRTAVVERHKLGGVCLHYGCVPTKVLLHTAELVEKLKKAQTLGIETGPVRVDYARLQKRKATVVEGLHKGVQYLMRKHKIDVLEGTGALLGRTRIGVALSDGSETELEARHTLLATGSAPRSIPGIVLDNERVLDSTGALALTEVPKTIAILGAGAIGVEFASLFAALGSEVTLIELLPTLLPLEDPEIGRTMERLFARRGMKIYTGTTASGVVRSGSGLAITLNRGGETIGVEADYLLVAVGRGPVTDGLGLETAGVETQKGAVVVDAQLRTSVPEMYAVGDVIARPFRLAHVASDEAIHAVETIAGVESRSIDYQAVPRPTFSIPQVASMGLSEQQALEAGHEVKVGRFAFQANSKATIEGERDGFVKAVTDHRTGEILGIHMLGPAVTELLAEGVLARYLEGTVVELGGAVHAHPTLSETLKEAALDALAKGVHG